MKTTTCFGVLTALLLTAPAAFATHCHENDHFKVGLYYSAKAGSTAVPASVMAQLTLSRTSYNGTATEAVPVTESSLVELKAVGDHFFAATEIVSKVGECTDTVVPKVKFVVFNTDGSVDASAKASTVKTNEGTGPVLETETNAVLSKVQYAD